MPNEKVLAEKKAVVASLTEKLQNAAAGVIVDHPSAAYIERPLDIRTKRRRIPKYDHAVFAYQRFVIRAGM